MTTGQAGKPGQRRPDEVEAALRAEVARLRAENETVRTALGVANDWAERFETAAAAVTDALRTARHAHVRDMRDQRERIQGQFAYRLGAAVVNARSVRGVLGLPTTLWREHRAFRTERANAAPKQPGVKTARLEKLAPGALVLTHAPAFRRLKLVEGRLLRVTGYCIGRDSRAPAPLTALVRYRASGGGSTAGNETAAVLTEAVACRKDHGFELVLTPAADAAVAEIAFIAPRGEVLFLNLETIEQPRPETLRRWRTGEAAMNRVVRPFGRWTLRLPRPGPRRKARALRADELDIKMWAGYSRIAIPDLEALRDDQEAPGAERKAAAWSLARWFYTAGEPAQALSNLDAARRVAGGENKDSLLCRMLCLLQLQRCEEAREELDAGVERHGPGPDLTLLDSTCARALRLRQGASEAEAEHEQLQRINAILREAGAAEIRPADPARGLRIWNLTTSAGPCPDEQAQKVSVIMPAYNAAQTIGAALESLMAQTWTNLEVIVVDDRSTDDTAEVVQALSERDPRIRLIRSPRNQGAYPSRNIGLGHATGDLFMVHDSDDWSHPEKIERQVRLLAENPACKAVMSRWIRVTERLEVVGPWIPKSSLFELNFSSLMTRREVIDEIGPWDEVRVSGDAEFRSRIMKAYGDDAVCVVKAPAFLSFALTRPDSLTQAGPTHIRTLKYGLRAQYRDSYSDWHRKGEGDPSRLRLDPRDRPYVAPLGVLIERPVGRRYDLVVASDFALKGGAFGSTLNYILAAREAGLSVAVCHWRKYDLRADAILNPRLYEACTAHGIDILTVGDTVEADTVLIGYPAVLQHRPDALPEVKAKQVLVIVNQYASRLADGSDVQYDPAVARRNLKDLFGHEGLWIPISDWVRRLMSENDRYSAPYPEPWIPMIRAADWFHRPIRWNGCERAAPVVGRHGRDAYTKWPTTAEAIRQAYGVGRPWEMRFLGGARHAVETLGFQPENWTVLGFDTVPTPDFLDGLDIFIHYPHEAYIEEFGRATLEAMAAGKPVVLAPQFRETFGEAALYAEPAEVGAVIDGLWADEAAYLERAEIGRAFVRRYSDLAGFPERLERALAYLAAGRADQRKQERRRASS